MTVHRRVPVVTTTKRRCQFSRRRHVRVAVEHVRNLVRIFLVDARERELGKTLRRFRIKGRLFCSCRQRPLRLEVSGKRNARNNQPNTEDPFHSARILNRTLRACHAEAFSVGEAGWTFSNKSQSLMRFVHLFIFPALLSAFQITAVSAADPIDNPLLKESTLPYHLPPFDQIKDQHFVPAMEAGMRDQLKEVDAVANNPEKPTFENTVVALERTGRSLDRAERTFSNLNACNTNPALQKIDKEMAPKLSAHRDAIHLNGKLFARIQQLYDNRDTLGLDSESAYLLERYYKDFVRAGAKLSDSDKEKLKKINVELATLQTQFEQNVLKEKNASSIVVDRKEDLAGLSDNQMASVTAAAKAEHKEGKFVIQLQNTTGQPLLGSLQNRQLRERIMQTSFARNSKGGEFDTRRVVLRTSQLRGEKAKLLGYANWGAYQLEDQTAHDVPTVNKLLGDLAPPAVANAKREAADMQKIVDQENGRFQVAAWDWDFYSEKVRKARYAFDESELRPYYELNHVILDGVFFAAGNFTDSTSKKATICQAIKPTAGGFKSSIPVANPSPWFSAIYIPDPPSADAPG